MVEDHNIIVLQHAEGVCREGLVHELTARGFAVRRCESVLGLCQLYTSAPASIVVLAGNPHRLLTDVIKIREQSILSVIVVLGLRAGKEERVRTMTAGADAYCDMFVDINELTAILAAWRRYAGVVMSRETRTTLENGEETFPSWQLRADGRVLISPSGRALPLTCLESRLLRHMAASDGHLLRRNSQSNMEDGSNTPSETLNLEVLVSRLRRKAQCAGIKLPLVAIRSCGYLFAEQLNMSSVDV